MPNLVAREAQVSPETTWTVVQSARAVRTPKLPLLVAMKPNMWSPSRPGPQSCMAKLLSTPSEREKSRNRVCGHAPSGPRVRETGSRAV